MEALSILRDAGRCFHSSQSWKEQGGKMRTALGEGRSQQGGEPSECFSHHYQHYLSPPGHTANSCMTEMISEALKDNIIV